MLRDVKATFKPLTDKSGGDSLNPEGFQRQHANYGRAKQKKNYCHALSHDAPTLDDDRGLSGGNGSAPTASPAPLVVLICAK